SAPVVMHVSDAATGTCPKTVVRTYKATDACGNVGMCIQTITVHDTIPPVFLCASALERSPQGRSWFFGNHAGLKFTPSWTVTPMTGALETGEGCSAVDDPSGNPLFYTDGQTVFNKNDLAMPNGTGLLGHQSATQSGIIVPWPGTTKYFLFTVDATENGLANGLYYSVVDMTLASGLGDVVVSSKNTLLHARPVTER